jgi:hypothetical protein
MTVQDAKDSLNGGVDEHTYNNSFKMLLQNRNINKMQMNFCRKLFAIDLRQSGIESEIVNPIVNPLQARILKTIFPRHYFRPSVDYYRGRV